MRVIERLWLVYSMPQDGTESIFFNLVRSLDGILNLCVKSSKRNICDVEVFDGVLSQYFSRLNSLDILIQPLLRVIVF